MGRVTGDEGSADAVTLGDKVVPFPISDIDNFMGETAAKKTPVINLGVNVAAGHELSLLADSLE